MIFDLEFEFTYGQSWPKLEFFQDIVKIKEVPVNNYKKLVTFSVDIQQFPFVIENVNKKESDTLVENNVIIQDQIVKLQNIWAENILLNLGLLINYTNFVPNYHNGYLNYCKEHNIVLESSLQSYSFYFNGKFYLNFELPFWHWYAQIRKPIQSDLSQQQINLYIGEIGNDQVEHLRNLKDLLNSV
jgi:hypothetical protein